MSARWAEPLLLSDVVVLSLVSWRWAFPLFGLLGVVWAVAFYVWFRDYPRDHPRVNAAELELLQGNEANLVSHARVPGQACDLSGRLAAMGQLLLHELCLYFISLAADLFAGSAGYIPKYAAALAGMPLFFAASVAWSPAFSRWLVRRSLSVMFVRRLLGSVGCAGASGMLLCPSTSRTRYGRCWRWACPASAMT